jgi:hypothetical protein
MENEETETDPLKLQDKADDMLKNARHALIGIREGAVLLGMNHVATETDYAIKGIEDAMELHRQAVSKLVFERFNAARESSGNMLRLAMAVGGKDE